MENMDNKPNQADSTLDYTAYNESRVLEAYYEQLYKLADKFESGIRGQFEWESERISASVNYPDENERNRLIKQHEETAVYLESDALKIDALEHAAARLSEVDNDLHKSRLSISNTREYEFLAGKYFDKKLQEALDLEDALRADMGKAQTALVEHQNSKPALLQNIDALLRGGDAWEADRAKLQGVVDEASDKYYRQSLYVISRLSLADARDYAIEQVNKYHHSVAEEHRLVEQGRIEAGLKHDPIGTYENLVKEFASDCSRLLKREIAAIEETVAAQKTSLQEHDTAKPGFVRNALSLGRLSREWEAVRSSIADAVSSAESCIARLEKRRLDNQRGDTQDALSWAMSKVAETYPALAAAYDTAIARKWQAKNQNRLERVPEQSETRAVEKSVER